MAMAEMPPIALNHLNDCRIEQRNTVPQDVASRSPYEQRSLTNGEVRLDPDPDQSAFLEANRVPVGQPQLVMRSPLLTGRFHVLAVVLTDDA